ncbi:DUF805 domain-containing protein [Gymnodinialimonas ulvae]|uniref:DUF805 domain-containing protein n=1 Tax=Gymnodinialimonas ulvae TaxID=3126504 RepID=UPI00309D65A8
MDFMTAVRHVFANYANFSGRARRSEFWWWTLFAFILAIVAQIIDAAIGIPILYVVVSLGLLIPNIAVSVRRMHDIGRSGWWVLIFLIPIVNIIMLLVWFTQRGTVGPNEFGGDPYDAPVGV